MNHQQEQEVEKINTPK